MSLFAAPPRVGYPVTLSVAPDGAVYVAVDEQGSLGRTPGGRPGRPLHRRRRRRQGRPRERVRQDGAPARRDRAGREGLGPASADAERLPRRGRRRHVRSAGRAGLRADDEPDRRAGRRPHDQRHPHGARRLDLHRRRRLRVPRREGEGRHHALATRRRHPPRAARRHRAGGLRHRPAQPVRHRDRPLHEPLHARQHQRRRRLGRAREPPDPDRRLRLSAEVRQLPRRDHAAARGLRPGRRDRRAVRCTTSAGPKPIAAPCSRATGAGARSTGTT